MASNVPVNQFGYPGLVTPGPMQILTGKRMQTTHSLLEAMMSNPEQLQGAVYDCLAMYDREDSYTPIVSTILAAMSGEEMSKVTDGENPYTRHVMSGRNPGVTIDNWRFWYPIRTPKNHIFKVVEAPTGVNIGLDDTEFTFTVTRGALTRNDVMGYGPMAANLQLRVMKVEPRGDVQRITVIQHGGIKNVSAQVAYLQVGNEIDILYNVHPELSEFGSQANILFNRSARESTTTMRWEQNVSGHVHHTKLNGSKKGQAGDPMQVQTYKWHAPDGKVHDMFLTLAEAALMKKIYKELDQQMFFGKTANTVDGAYSHDGNGNTYYTGRGIWEQCNRRAFHQYSRIDARFYDNLIGRFIEKNNGNYSDLLLIAGFNLRREFSNYLASQFKYNPLPLYYDRGSGRMMTKEDGDIPHQAIRMRFSAIHTANGRIILSDNTYFDQKNVRRSYLPGGDTANSWEGICLDLTKVEGVTRNSSICPIIPVVPNGRQMVTGQVNGMAVGGMISTPKDMVGKHWLTQQGVAVVDPNCLHFVHKV